MSINSQEGKFVDLLYQELDPTSSRMDYTRITATRFAFSHNNSGLLGWLDHVSRLRQGVRI